MNSCLFFYEIEAADSCKRCSKDSSNQNAMLFEFYEKLINASSQTISSSFDYNSHDMLNKLRKFSRNKLHSKNDKYRRLLFFSTYTETSGIKSEFPKRRNGQQSSYHDEDK